MTSLLEKHAKSFYWASFFLSKEIFYKCSSLYNFCRTLDDIVDDDKKLGIKKENFLKFKNEFIDRDNDNPIIKEMWSIIDEERISKQVVMDLFDGVQTDLKEKVEINSNSDSASVSLVSIQHSPENRFARFSLPHMMIIRLQPDASNSLDNLSTLEFKRDLSSPILLDLPPARIIPVSRSTPQCIESKPFNDNSTSPNNS